MKLEQCLQVSVPIFLMPDGRREMKGLMYGAIPQLLFLSCHLSFTVIKDCRRGLFLLSCAFTKTHSTNIMAPSLLLLHLHLSTYSKLQYTSRGLKTTHTVLAE